MIRIEGIQKSFGGEPVLKNISFSMGESGTLSVLGKSGCGKTTLLKILAGLEMPDSGKFLLKEQNLFEKPAQERGVVYLSQEPLLFPHLNIFENIAFGLRIRKTPEQEVQNKVKALSAELGIEDHLKKMPTQISGGQRQRVSFGRALIINPSILLLDEPFSSLDVQTRDEMQKLYKSVSAEHKITALFVTHDLKEAIIMGDALALMEKGMLKKYDSMSEFINDPTSGVKEAFDFWQDVMEKNLADKFRAS